ncbi:MAG: hypothetical protein SGJ20_00875 [Planctomycetota bacterium]|nr:hypothetical protein [Planctomycetota bacterium]
MKRRWKWLLVFLLLTLPILAGWAYVRANPLVFNESFWHHAHCIKIAGLELEGYAEQHNGQFPSHPRGYPNALLLMDENCFSTLTGPGYDETPLLEAKRTGRQLTEAECGRVYIQGLTQKSNPRLVLLFDKLPTPGGDHCHFLGRMSAPLGREVWYVGTGHEFIEENQWPTFAANQVQLLVQEGYDPAEAQRLYASQP